MTRSPGNTRRPPRVYETDAGRRLAGRYARPALPCLRASVPPGRQDERTPNYFGRSFVTSADRWGETEVHTVKKARAAAAAVVGLALSATAALAAHPHPGTTHVAQVTEEDPSESP